MRRVGFRVTTTPRLVCRHTTSGRITRQFMHRKLICPRGLCALRRYACDNSHAQLRTTLGRRKQFLRQRWRIRHAQQARKWHPCMFQDDCFVWIALRDGSWSAGVCKREALGRLRPTDGCLGQIVYFSTARRLKTQFLRPAPFAQDGRDSQQCVIDGSAAQFSVRPRAPSEYFNIRTITVSMGGRRWFGG
jgi:hypothetical protein